jgi:hypothetical protein
LFQSRPYFWGSAICLPFYDVFILPSNTKQTIICRTNHTKNGKSVIKLHSNSTKSKMDSTPVLYYGLSSPCTLSPYFFSLISLVLFSVFL